MPTWEPGRYDFTVVRGVDWERSFTLYEDQAKTKPVNLTGHLAFLVVGPAGSEVWKLEEGAGADCEGASGKILCSMSASVTKVNVPYVPSEYHWYLLVEVEATSEVMLAVHGTCTIEDP